MCAIEWNRFSRQMCWEFMFTYPFLLNNHSRKETIVMNKQSPSHPMILSTLEEVFQKPFTQENLDFFASNPDLLKKFKDLVDDQNQEPYILEKRANEFRPYIHPHIVDKDRVFASSDMTGLGFSKYDDPKAWPSGGIMANRIKKYLLFSHSLCIEDPISSIAGLPLTPGIIFAWRELCREILLVKNLIQCNLLIFTPLHRHNALHNLLPRNDLPKGLDFPESYIAYRIVEQVNNQILLNGNIDLYFPNFRYIEIYKKSLFFHWKRFSEAFYDPYYVYVLSQLDSIDPQWIGEGDILQMRKFPQLFKEWRNFLRAVCKNFHRTPKEFMEFEEPFRVALQNEFNKRKQAFSVYAQGEASATLQHHLAAVGITGFHGW